MAAPADVTISDLSGEWIMNKSLSDDTEDVFIAQQIGWVLRRALGMATISLSVQHLPANPPEPEKINIDQSLSGLTGTREERTLDWQERPHEDYVFGKVIGRSKRCKIDEVEDETGFLQKGWTEDTVERGVVKGLVKSVDYGWTAEQTWGFQVINGERRYVRKLKFITAEGERLDKTLVYDWVPKA